MSGQLMEVALMARTDCEIVRLLRRGIDVAIED